MHYTREDTILTVRVAAYSILAIGWLLWMLPFLLFKQTAPAAKVVDRRARWGVVLIAISYSLLWQSHFWERRIEGWRMAISLLLFLIATLLSWTARRALGEHWRIDAGLNADHELVRGGPYGVVRHPIYTSMLCVLLATGGMITPWWLLAVSLLFFFAGTEIRVRIEDRLLSSRFSEQFREYQDRVPAYVPWVR